MYNGFGLLIPNHKLIQYVLRGVSLLGSCHSQSRPLKEWLESCYAWIEQEHHLDPATQMDEIIRQVDAQLLQSDLSDSMLAGTGLPHNIAELTTTFAGPILVEIVSLTDIGTSAFTLQTTRQARMEYDESPPEEEEEDNGKPEYPRATLRFNLSDGATIIKGWEYQSLPEIVLGETPLGYKVRDAPYHNVLLRRLFPFISNAPVELHVHDLLRFEHAVLPSLPARISGLPAFRFPSL